MKTKLFYNKGHYQVNEKTTETSEKYLLIIYLKRLQHLHLKIYNGAAKKTKTTRRNKLQQLNMGENE